MKLTQYPKFSDASATNSERQSLFFVEKNKDYEK